MQRQLAQGRPLPADGRADHIADVIEAPTIDQLAAARANAAAAATDEIAALRAKVRSAKAATAEQVAAARSEAEAAATDEIAALRAQAESAPSAETGRLLSALKDANGHVAELRRVLIMLFVFVALAERVVFDYIPAESYRYTR